MKIITTLILLALCASAQARIGETVEECVKRYGKPTKVDEAGRTFQFHSDDVKIDITFAAGRCVCIQYYQTTKAVFSGGDLVKSLSEPEKDVLLEANAGGQKWVKNEGWAGYPLKTETRSLFASRDESGKLKIITPEAAIEEMRDARLAKEATQAKEKAAAASRLKGL